MRILAALALGISVLAAAGPGALAQSSAQPDTALEPNTPDGTDPSAQGIVMDDQVDPSTLPHGLAAAAAQLVPVLGRVTGMPMLVLERTGDDPGQFWYSAMSALCAKTGDNWCDGDVQVLTDTTNLLGWSRVLTYQPRDGQGNTTSGATKQVCVILPPKPGVSAGFTAIGLAGGGAFTTDQLPTDDEAEAYLYLMHAASCLSTGADPATEQKRSDSYAALALTLLEGSPAFVSGQAVSPARKFSNYRSGEAVRWSVSVGERVLFDLWKGQAVQVLQQGGCNAMSVPSDQIDTQSIQRDASLPPGGDCLSTATGGRQGTVTDADLWLWGPAGVSMPPQPYTGFMSFPTTDDGVRYAWTTAGSIATQR